jgi:hypothetical protein
MRITKLLALILILAALAVAQAKQTDALTEGEQSSLKAAQANVDSARADRDKAWALIQQTSVRDVVGCVSVVGTAHEVEQRVALAESQQRAVVAEVRANHNCGDCNIAPDGKALVRK